MGSRVFNKEYSSGSLSSLEKMSIIPGNYDILHVTNRTINKARVIEDIIPRFYKFTDGGLHTQFGISTVIRLINHGKVNRENLCVYPNCTGILLDFLGWNTNESIQDLSDKDIKKV